MSDKPHHVGIASRVYAVFAKLLIGIFGRPNWDAPSWLKWIGKKLRSLGRWSIAHQGASFAILFALSAATAGGWKFRAWWNARPKPALTNWTVAAPTGLPRFDGMNKIDLEPMSISFSRSAAPIATVDKVITKGIEITPAIAGEWKWAGDRNLVFTPKGDWAIGQKYTVKLTPKDLVATHVLIEKQKEEFETAPFQVYLDEQKYYQDPLDENLKRVLATFRFSHPVDAASFEKLVKLHFVPTTADEKEQDYKFEVSYEKMLTLAYVKSTSITLPQKNATMHITVDPGTKAKRGSAPFDKKLAGKTNVPGLYNFIGIDTVASYVVDNERMEADVVLRIESNARISAAEIKKNIQVWQLPLYYEEEEKEKKRPHRWNNEEVDTKSLKKNDLVALTQLPERDDPSEGHTFRYRAEAGRYLYVEIAKGTKAFGGYVLAEAHNAVVRVPKAPPRVKLMHQGSLISLSGERKIGAAVRDAPAVRYEVARVLGDQTHHLFTATNGSFADPSFKYPFTEQNFTERFEEVHVTKAPAGKNTFDALDLGKYLGGSEGKRGLFVVKVQSWDPEANRSLGETDQRLMLVTDLGMVVKDAADGTHQVFVQSIHTGEAVAGAKVQVLGKNGAAVVSESTNGQGMATLPSFAGFTEEKTPIVYVASRGKDATYLPVGRSERYVNMSRFNTGGVHQDSNKKGMSAFVFSDRGIYRPGEEMIFGAIVRNDDWSKSLAGLPLLFVLTDARGKTLSKQQLNASPSAFEEYRYKTDETSPTGTYKLELFLADAKGAQSIGSTNVVVREFQPDKLKIAVTMNHPPTDGWLKPTDLKARVHLTNLFGTPATDRKVKGALSVGSGMPRFTQFKDYNFFDPLKPHYVSVERYEEQTDDEGNAEFDLDATAFADATYRLSFVAEGFEKEGGRSVGGEVGAWVSPNDYFLGYRTAADLGYLPKAAEAEVELVAVGPSGKRVAVKDLEVTIYEKKSLSVLAKEPDGTYRYETINREVEVSTKKLSINGDNGTKWKIPTAIPGSYVVKFFDKHVAVNSFDYLVAGAALEARAGGNADLQLNLKSKDVEAGQALSVQIKAPYTGAGLITIERDRVYTHRWFKTTTATSVQTINVPPAMEGDAYVSVIFLRDPSSPEVFLSPLSYGVVPFSISQAKRTAKLTLTSNDKVKPGETVSMKLVADKPTRAVVFAVDEGILRVARYQTPNPLKFFFQKRALSVQTAQLLDLVLPDFARLLKAYAPGGGDDEDGEGGGGKKALAANLNPFKRKTNKPVAYWSGIVDVGPEGKELSYVVPDYFNGTLRVMAVAAGPDAIGAAERETIVRGDFVLQPTAPLVVAPGDEFEVPLLVANNVAGAGKKGADVEVALEVSKHFEIVGNAKHKVTIGEMKESSVSFKLKATKALGSGMLKFSAKTGDKGGKASIDISVRPSSPYLVTMKGGRLAAGEAKVQLDRKMYPEYREQKAGISYLPVGLSHGLTKYLEKFPHACTEQVTSMAVPAIVLGQLPEFGFKPAEVAQSWETYINTLRARQTTTGAFGRWARNPRIDSYASLYATHVMLEAKDRGQKVPDDVLKLSLAYAQTVAADTIETMEDARSRAYAIYVLTRAGKTTTPLSAKLQKQLEVKFKKEWKQDLAAVYLAAALKLGKQDKLGEGLLESIKLNAKIKSDYASYYDPLMRDTQVLYLIAKHFPERLAGIPAGDVEAALAPIYNGGFNTFSAAFGVMALEQYGKAAEQLAPDALSIAEQTGDSGVPKSLALPKSMMPFVPFEDVATKLVFGNKGQVGAYWLVSEQGFDVSPGEKPIVQKLEVSRRMFNAEGKEITEIGIGEEVTMHVLVRSLGGEIPMLALIDLLPGGFEVVINDEAPAADSADDEQGGDAPPRDRDEGEEGGEGGDGYEGEGSEGDDTGAGDSNSGASFSLPFADSASSFSPEYGDVREDRIVLYGSASSTVQTFIYKAKATTAGSFQVPPVQASSMYDRTVLARSAPAKIKVIKK